MSTPPNPADKVDLIEFMYPENPRGRVMGAQIYHGQPPLPEIERYAVVFPHKAPRAEFVKCLRDLADAVESGRFAVMAPDLMHGKEINAGDFLT